MCSLVDAGVEGGSWDRIVKWKLDRVRAMNSYWRRNGPPLNVSAHVIGQALGIDWSKLYASPDPIAEMPAGPSIAELAAMAPVPL